MESRVLAVLLALVPLAASLAGCAGPPLRQPPASDAGEPPVIEPEVERREIETADIDTENFEAGVFVGQMSVEDFGVNTVFGGRFAYHITDGLFAELAFGRTDTDPTSFERLSGAAQLLTASERELTYYNVSMGYNLLPGESFIGRNRALNTALYVIGGVGNTKFAGADRFTVNLGMGLRIMPRDWFAIHADVRDHLFDVDLLGYEKTTHNLEAHVGVTVFF